MAYEKRHSGRDDMGSIMTENTRYQSGSGKGLFDTHCHLDIERHFPNFEAELKETRRAGVSNLVLAGVVRDNWQRIIELSTKFHGVHAAPGLHPMYLKYHQSKDLDELDALSQSEGIVAIGEVGLDYFIPDVDRVEQQILFESQIDIASRASLPLLLHVRKAHDQVLSTLRRKKFHNGGIVHAFNGSYQQASHFINLGFMIGICGTVTYERSRKIRNVAAMLPLESLVLETDAPDIPPVTHWKEKNRSAYLPEVLNALTQIRSDSRNDIEIHTTQNALRVLRLL